MSGAPVTEKHRELARQAFEKVSSELGYPESPISPPEQRYLDACSAAIADAEARGREAGLRDALHVADHQRTAASIGYDPDDYGSHVSENKGYLDCATCVYDAILALLHRRRQ